MQAHSGGVNILMNTESSIWYYAINPAEWFTTSMMRMSEYSQGHVYVVLLTEVFLDLPGTIIKFIANYIKGRKTYTTYRNHTSRRQFKTGVPQGGVLSPTLFNMYTSDLPHPSSPGQVMAYANDITITSTQARVQPRNIYNHTNIKFLPGQN